MRQISLFKNNKENIVAVVLGMVLVTLFLWGNIIHGSINFNPYVGTDDLMDTNVPFRAFLNESYKKGEIPAWSNLISAGYPLLAEGQMAAFYPLNLLTIYLTPHTSILVSLLICYITIYIFSFFFLRELGLGYYVSLFGAMVATFSGFPANEIQHLGMLTSYSYFVVILYFIEREVKETKFVYFLLTGILLGLSVLGGHPQIVFYSLLFIYPYWLIRKIIFISKHRQNTNLAIRKFAVGILLFSVIGLGIGAGQIIPMYEFTVNSTRSTGLTAQSAGRYSMSFADIIAFVSPFAKYSSERSIGGFATNGWPRDEMYIFVGIIPFILAIPALFSVRKNYFAAIFTATLVLSYMFSMGGNFIFGSLLTIPPFSFFRIPFRISFLMTLALSYLSALGLEKLTAKKFLYAMTLETSDKNYERIRNISAVVLCLLAFINMKDNFKKLYSDVDANKWYKEPEVVSYLKDNLKDNERVTSELYFYASYPYFVDYPAVWNDPESHRNLRNLLPPFSGLLYRIPQNVGAANSAGLKISRMNELESEIYFNGWKIDEKGNFSVTDPFLFLNRIMGVKYILSNKQFTSYVTSMAKKIEMPTGEAPIYVYEFFDYFPRQFLVPRAEKAEPEKIKEHLMKVDFEPLQKIFIEEDTDWGAAGGFAANSHFEKYTDNEVAIKTQASGDGFLFLSDTYYPGWKAWVDGNETEILRANYAFRAVKVPAGEHTVTMKYQPQSIKLGLIITVITFAASFLSVMALFVWGRFRKKKIAISVNKKKVVYRLK